MKFIMLLLSRLEKKKHNSFLIYKMIIFINKSDVFLILQVEQIVKKSANLFLGLILQIKVIIKVLTLCILSLHHFPPR